MPSTKNGNPLYQSWAYRQLRTQVFRRWKAEGLPCYRCHRPLNWEKKGRSPEASSLDHIHPLALNGEELPAVEDCGVSHLGCNSAHGARMQAKLQGKRVKPQPDAKTAQGVVLEPPAPQPRARPRKICVSRDLPRTLSKSPRLPGPLDGLPRMFPDVHPSAAASLGDGFAAYAEARAGRPLRWWQWVTAQRRYEIDKDGNWCWPLVWTSVSRQSGKSASLIEDACWYSDRSPAELTVHVANTVTSARSVQMQAWLWAEQQGWRVDRLLGDSMITWPNGAQWLTLAMGSAYGRSPHRLLVDEAWALDQRLFWDALYPALGAHDNTQVLFFSAANLRDKGLVHELRGREDVCRMEWGALDGEDPSDPAVWQASSPYWNPGRQRLMAQAAGSPSFEENWLNVWNELAGDSPEEWLDRSGWDEGRGDPGAPSGPVVCALDSSPDGLRFAVSAAWMRDGRIHVRSSPYLEHRQQAIDWVQRFRPRVCLVGIGLVKLMPRSLGFPIVGYGSRETALGSGPFAAAVRDARIVHDGMLDDEAYGAVAETRGSEGLVMVPKRSVMDVSRVKLALWLVHYCERNDSVLSQPPLRIL